MTWLLDLLRKPSAFRADPWGHVENQLGHAYLVGGLVTWFLLPWWVVLIAFAVWEIAQVALFDAEPDDSFEDFGHVACGALAAGFHNPTFLLVQLAFLAAGFLFRRRTAP